MAHYCHAIACKTKVPPAMLMCRKHWYKVPYELRVRVWQLYVRGQEVRKDPTPAYIKAASEAIQAVERSYK